MFADAPVGADPESSMDNFFAMDVKLPWVGTHLGITRGGCKVERHSVSPLDLDAADFHIGTYRAPDGNDRRMETDRFFHRCR